MKKSILLLLFIVIILLSVFTGAEQRTAQPMAFSDLLQKLAGGETLTEGEQQSLLLEARNMEQAVILINSILKPGTGVLKVDNAEINNAKIDEATITNAIIESATAGDGFVTIDSNGIAIDNDSEGTFSIKDVAGNRNTIFLTVGTLNGLYLVNESDPNGGIWFRIKLTSGNDAIPELRFVEDPDQANRPYLKMTEGIQGARFALDNLAKIDLRTQGTSGGSTFMRMLETTNTPPAGSNDAYHMYMKGDKLIIQFDAAGTPHYFYLNLTATSNQSWIYSATAP